MLLIIIHLLQSLSRDDDDITLYPSSGSSVTSPVLPKKVCLGVLILLSDTAVRIVHLSV